MDSFVDFCKSQLFQNRPKYDWLRQATKRSKEMPTTPSNHIQVSIEKSKSTKYLIVRNQEHIESNCQMGGSASKNADLYEDNMKCDYNIPTSLGDMAGTIQKEAEFIVSVISSIIMSNKARDSQLNLHAAVQLFKEGRSDEALQELEKFKNSENPFTGLPEKLEKVRQQQVKLAEKLNLYRNKIKKKQVITMMGRIAADVIFLSFILTLFTCQAYVVYSGLLSIALPVLGATSATISAWAVLDSQFTSYYDTLKRQKDLVRFMMTQRLIEEKDFDEIQMAAEDTGNKLRSLKGNAEFALEGEWDIDVDQYPLIIEEEEASSFDSPPDAQLSSTGFTSSESPPRKVRSLVDIY
ncbi:hypothetical protein MRB53_021492 [Persea americana]|uniref:Uncharacterized protein n=1 Tax=Persea americana TaxID=3435 RepID=A0ACC2L426_PERAE|nr:hypothetical protein MRB53_021492 [Persea americana]